MLLYYAFEYFMLPNINYPNNKQAILLPNILLFVFGSMYYLVPKKKIHSQRLNSGGHK